MNILLLGSGGREHALAWKIKQSSLCHQLYIAPGNAGTSDCGINVPIGVSDFEALETFCLTHSIDLVLPGSEEPLVAGIVDYFQGHNLLKRIPVIGPTQAAAQLEGSKSFAKAFMKRHGIPTAGYAEFDATQLDEAKAYIRQHPLPIVLKADGLAAGKGVIISEDAGDAVRELEAMLLGGKFGKSGSKVVIEEFLSGIEVSVFVLTDGTHFLVLPEAKDYKRIGEGDTGLNTGGMGAVSPVPFADKPFMDKVQKQIIEPTIAGLREEHLTYTGFIFLGLIKVGNEPYVIEYNCRLGDPETEVVLPRLNTDLLELLKSIPEGKLSDHQISTDHRVGITVILVSGGYPEAYEKGKAIHGLDLAGESLIFHAGTIEDHGIIKTNGGRVLAITSLDESLAAAQRKSMEAAMNVQFEGKYYRTDIGWEFEPRNK